MQQASTCIPLPLPPQVDQAAKNGLSAIIWQSNYTDKNNTLWWLKNAVLRLNQSLNS